MTRLMEFLLRAYKLLLSPHSPGVCGFEPSCSAYAAEAVARHGAVRGAAMAGRRLLRCHPLTRGGFDPVPIPPSQALRYDGIRRPMPPPHAMYCDHEGKTN